MAMAMQLAALKRELADKDAELQRCHKRLRQLEAMALVPQRPELSTSSEMLDIVLYTVAISKAPRLGWVGVPAVAKDFDDREWAKTLVAVSGTCRAARASLNASGEMDAYLNDCKLRKVKGLLRKFLDSSREAFMLDRSPDVSPRALLSYSEIGETPETLEREHPGITRRALLNRGLIFSDSSEDETSYSSEEE